MFKISPLCISIHALLTESDFGPRNGQGVGPDFYPRSPYGERHTGNCYGAHLHFDFYPRSPYGERQFTHKLTQSELPFLSTLSLRRATMLLPIFTPPRVISIHALLTESDRAGPPTAGPAAISIHALLTESDLIFTARQAAIRIFLSTLSLRRATLASILCTSIK